jgi:hypothetical protein
VFAIITAVVAVWNLSEAFPATEERRSSTMPVLAIIAFALWVVSGSLYAWAGEGRTVGTGERPHTFAHAACKFLARPEMPQRVISFNLGQAGVCTYYLRPDQHQFLDPRLEVNSADTFKSYIEGISRLVFNQPGWEMPLGVDYTKPEEVPAILIEHGPLDRAAITLSNNPRWKVAYSDDVASVFLPIRAIP